MSVVDINWSFHYLIKKLTKPAIKWFSEDHTWIVTWKQNKDEDVRILYALTWNMDIKTRHTAKLIVFLIKFLYVVYVVSDAVGNPRSMKNTII